MRNGSFLKSVWFQEKRLRLLCRLVQLLSRVWLFVTPWTAGPETISWSLLKLMSVESVMPSNHFILCCPLLLLLSIFPSIKVFSNKSVFHIRWPKYWSFSFNISPSNEYSRQISLSSLKWKWSRSVVSNSLWPHGCSTPGFPVHRQLLELA